MAAFKAGSEVWSAVFDGTATSGSDWLDCSRLLYSHISGFDSDFAAAMSYSCGVVG